MIDAAQTRRGRGCTLRWNGRTFTTRSGLWTLALLLPSLVLADHPLQGSFVGTTEAGPVLLQLHEGPFGLTGFVQVGDAVYVSVSAWAPAADGGLAGSFTDEGLRGGFEVHRDGDVVTFVVWDPDGVIVSDGEPVASFSLTYAPDVPRELGRGRHATLLERDALAFIEALEEVQTLLGLDEPFSHEDREAVIAAMPEFFVFLSRLEQLVVADAAAIWAAAQANWASASEQDRRTFALGLVTLAYGEASVQAWLGIDGRAGRAGPLDGSATCDSLETCLQAFVDPQTWREAAAAQGCWSIAGCLGYDHVSGTFEYEPRD